MFYHTLVCSNYCIVLWFYIANPHKCVLEMTKDNFKGFIPRQGIENRWGILDSLVYLSFVEPKTQKEAVKLLYNKSYEEVNMRPFREARKKLTQQGYLKHDGSMRNATFTSSMQAFVEQVNSNMEERRGRSLTEEEREGLYKITDSEWFRNFFGEDYLETLYGVGRNESGRLDYTTAGDYSMKVIGQVIHDAWGIGYRPEGQIKNDFELTDLTNYASFKEFQDKHSGFFLEKLESRFGDELTKEDVIEIISEDHLIEERFEWRTSLLDNLVYESEMLFKLPRIPPKIMDCIPGREHSYYAARSCDMAVELKKRYVLDKGSFLTNTRETGRVKTHPALDQILDEEKVEKSLTEEEEVLELDNKFHELGTSENLEDLKGFDISDLEELIDNLDLADRQKEVLMDSARQN
jgi:hypothetical protein